MKNRRKKLFIDQNIQGYLIMSLVLLEVVIVVTAMSYLYFEFNAIFDANIYQIHKSHSNSIYKLLDMEMAKVVIVTSLINLTVLFIANLLWLRHIKKIIAYFRNTMQSIKNLSLNFSRPDDLPSHDLTQQLEKWQQHEKTRAQKIHDLIISLPEDPEMINKAELMISVNNLQSLLKVSV